MSNPATPGSPATPAPGGGAGSSTTPSGSSAAPTTASGGAGTATPPRGAARAGISARASVGGVGVPIRFLDMKERNDAERDRLKARQFELLSLASQLSAQGSGSSLRAAATNPATPVLPPDLQQELADIDAELKADTDTKMQPHIVLDPFFNQPTWDQSFDDPGFTNTTPAGSVPGVRDVLGTVTGTTPVGNHTDGLLPSQQGTAPGPLTASETALAAVYGLMENDNITDPTLENFVASVSIALGEYTQSQPLFDRVLKLLIDEVTPQGTTESDVRADQWTAIARILFADGVSENDANIVVKFNVAYQSVAGGDETAQPSAISIDLPDLEAQTAVEIQADNLRAVQAIYFAAQLEELKMFQVVDKLVELFMQGMLPLGRGRAGNGLYDYWKKSVNRMTEVERRNLYARTIGLPGGDPSVTANREFNDLWLRFVSAVSSFVRQVTVNSLLTSNIPFPVSPQQVKKAGRDLAANLSLHGYGIGYFAATELQTQLKEIIALLSDTDIKTAYGAKDLWQVIDQVASLELGGAKNSIRYRTMANAGAIIIRWLAERASLLASTVQVNVIDINQIRNLNAPRRPGTDPRVAPTDRDLVDACDQWLAVTGTADKSVEDYAQPIEAPNQPTRPVYIPSVFNNVPLPQAARDLLASAGIQAPGPANGGAVMVKK